MTEALEKLQERLERLERRVLSLEGKMYHKGALSRALRLVIERWPGPFTADLIRDAVYELQPSLKPVTEEHQVSCLLTRMEKAGQIICQERGAGPTPNVYVRASRPPAQAGTPGTRFGTKHDYESGFRSIVRTAMEDLPETWTILDLRRWVSEKAPHAKVPFGSWSSTLYKMQQQGEIEVLPRTQWLHSSESDKRGQRRLKVYRRGSRRIGLAGDEIRELEAAWKQFRAEMGEMRSEAGGEWEFETGLQRGSEEVE